MDSDRSRLQFGLRPAVHGFYEYIRDPEQMRPNYIAAANPAAILELIQQRDELLAALKDARELVDDWGAYATAYMQEKHGLAEDLLSDWTPPYQRWRNNHDNNSIRRPIHIRNRTGASSVQHWDILRRNVAGFRIALVNRQSGQKGKAELKELREQVPLTQTTGWQHHRQVRLSADLAGKTVTTE